MSGMANEGLNKVRLRASDIPNIDIAITGNSYKPATRGEAAALVTAIGYLELSNNCPRIRVLDCDGCPITRNKLSSI
jgi:hypothetical protein